MANCSIEASNVITALEKSRGDYTARMVLTIESKDELNWWYNNIEASSKRISHGDPDLVMQSDASNKGWGAVHGTLSAGGKWTAAESLHHINYLELLAAFMALQTFCAQRKNVHIGIQIDNTTAVAYINAMGGIKSKLCNEIAQKNLVLVFTPKHLAFCLFPPWSTKRCC